MPRDTVEIEVLASPAQEIPLEPWQKILLESADLIEEKGWCQGAPYNSRGEHCMLGAVSAVTARKYAIIDGREATGRLKRRLGESPALYNDTAGRTKRQVLATLRAVAKGE